jgi:hypothetical protein
LEWESFHQLPITEISVVRGDTLAVEHNLGGYNATHLAYALIWQETPGLPVTLASFASQLIEAANGIQITSPPS